MIDRSKRLPRFFAALACSTLLLACGAGDPEKQLASAKAYLDKGELRSAVIELKTVLQQQPDRSEARFLLGKALLDGEDAVAAAVELRKARDLKHPLVEVDPLLARAMLAQGQASDVVAQYGAARLDDKAAQASVLTTVGLAYAQLGQLPKAEATLKQVGELMPSHVPAQVGLARLAAAKGDRDAALKIVEAMTASGAASADAWVLQGDLLAIEPQQRADAVAAYRKALSTDAKHVAAHMGIVRLLLAASDLDGASAQLAEMRKARPGHPATAFLSAQLAFEKRDFKAAREGVQQLLKGAPDHPMLNHLAGAIELAGGSNSLARAHLSKTVQAVPSNVGARRMFAAALLRAGEHDKAIEVLEPLLSSSATPDAAALALAGEAQLQAGNLDAAAQSFARAGKAQPDNALAQTALARTKFLKGDEMGAVADLERVAATDVGTAADLELVNAQLRRRDARAALKAIDGLERKMPGKPLPLYLRGMAHLQLKDSEQARASFEKAIGIDASYFPAVLSLAATEVAAAKLQDAQTRLEAFLKQHPGHARALLALAEVRTRQSAPVQEVSDLLTRAVQANPNEAALRVRLIEHHLLHKNVDVALSTAQQADAALPDQPPILDALGRAQFAAGQQNQAMVTFNKILSVQPKNTVAHLRVADLNVASKNKDAAILGLKRAIAAQPNVPVLYQRLFVLQAQTGRAAEALQLARDVQKRQPQHSLGWVLEGDALRLQRNDDAALAAYRTGSAKAAPTDAAIRYHTLLSAAGKRVEADKFDATWAKDHPSDFSFALYRADAALARREFEQAEVLYQKVLDMQPDSVPALNNLAWLRVKQNKPGALALAERANRLVPNNASLMDTLAMAMAADQQLDAAIQLQKKALALEPANDAVKLGMARLYVQSGRKTEAKELLEPLAQLGTKFPEHDEVKGLLAGL